MAQKKKPTEKRKTGELLMGPHSIIEALKARKRRLLSIYTTKPLPRSWKRIEPYLPKQVDNIQYVSANILSSMAGGTKHGGVLAWFTPLPVRSSMFTPKTHPFIVVLDGIQDVQNLGAIIRSAHCTGVTGLVMPQKHSAPLTGAAHRSSAGLAEHVDLCRVPSIHNALVEAQKAGYHLYLSVVNGGVPAQEVKVDGPTCLVIGSEEKGISPEVRRLGTRITLPQKTEDISYNASVAAGILMFLLGHQRLSD